MTDQIKKESAVPDPEVERLKKEAKVKLKLPQTPLIKPKFYYDVKVECMLPATLTYRVLAEDPQQAADAIRGMSPNGVRHRIVGKKDIKLTVYDAGSTMIKWMKNLLGT